MLGSATLTIDESIVAISEPNATETVTSHLFTSAGCTTAPGGRRGAHRSIALWNNSASTGSDLQHRAHVTAPDAPVASEALA